MKYAAIDEKKLLDVTPKEFPWYLKLSLIILPIISIVINLSVGVVFLIISIRQKTIDAFYNLKNTTPSTSALPWIPDPLASTTSGHDSNDTKPYFTLELIVACFFATLVIITRYIEVEKYYKRCSRENRASLYFGSMFVFGKLMLATLKNTLPNEISMSLYLAGATLYACTQVSIYCKDFNFSLERRFLQILRFIFCVGIFSNMILFGVFMQAQMPGMHVFDRFGFDVIKIVSLSVMVNITFQHIWSYHSEKIYRDYV